VVLTVRGRQDRRHSRVVVPSLRADCVKHFAECDVVIASSNGSPEWGPLALRDCTSCVSWCVCQSTATDAPE
jgi:hypothetical protein